MALFDDLIPSAGGGGASRSRGLFDDLLPASEPGSFLPEIGKGIAAGGISAVGTGIKGVGGQITAAQQEQVDTGRRRLDLMRRIDEGEDVLADGDLTMDETQLARDYASIEDPDVRARMRQEYESATANVQPGRVQDSALFKAGEAVQEFGKDKFAAAQDYEGSWTRSISEGLGSVGVMVGAGVLTGPAAPVIGAGIGSAMSAGEALDRAVEAGATQEQIVEAVRLGALPGLTEQIPIETLFERVPLPVVGKLGGAVSKILGQAFAEGGQEAVQQAAQNLIERFTYNPDQDITEGVAEAAAVGAAVGGIVKTGERAVSAVAGKADAPVTTAKTDRLPASIERPIAPEAVPGDTERLTSPRLTPEDRASPIPNDVIDDGKAILESIDKGIPVPGVTAPTAEETLVRDQEALTKQIELSAATPLERATLRVAGNTDEEIDVMSVEERRADFQLAIEAGVMPNAQDLAEAEKYKIAPQAVETQPPAAAEPLAVVEPPKASDAPSASVAGDGGDIHRRRVAAVQDFNAALKSGDEAATESARQNALSVFRELEQVDPKSFQHYANLPGNKRFFPELQSSTALSTVRGLETDGNRSRPAAIQAAEQIEAAVARVNTEPTEAQKEAGNYKKAHIKVNGYDIAIENPKGSIRSKKREDGSVEWQVKMPAHYGEIKRTSGADGDAVDVYVGDNPTSKRIYIVDQKAPVERGRFDEHKVVFGANSIQEAKDIYIRGFSDGSGRNRMGAIASVTPKAFREWLADPSTSNRPFSMGVVKTNEEGFPIDAKGAVKRPPSLTEFLAQNGGIREDMGELGAMDADKVFIPGVGKLVRPGGLTLDQARGMLVENGYLQDSEAGELSTSTVDDLLVALREDIANRDQFSVYDDDWATAFRDAKYNEEFAAWETRQGEQVLADLQAAGYPGTSDDAYAKRVVELVLSERMDLSDAAEQAAYEYEQAIAEDIVSRPAVEIPFEIDARDRNAPDSRTAQEGGTGVLGAGGQGERSGSEGQTEAGGNAAPVRGEPRAQEGSRDGDDAGAGQGAEVSQPQVDDFDAAFDGALDETFPTTEAGAEGKPQLVIPGAERIPDKQLAERLGAKPMRSDKPQRDLPAGGLFDDIARNQQDMFDQPAPKPSPTRDIDAARKYAEAVIGDEVQSVTLVGSAVAGKGRDIDLLYDLGDRGRNMPEGSDEAAEFVTMIVEGIETPIDLDLYDSFFKVGDRYFHIDSTAGRAMVENTEYAKEQSGRPTKLLASGHTAADSAKSAVKNVAMGLDDITKGLSELFGGTKVSSGLSFDEDTYAKAVPFFKAGIAHFAEAGRDVAGMVKALVQHLAKSGMDRAAIENMRPYVRRFVEDESKSADNPAKSFAQITANPVEKINTPAREGVLGLLVDRLLSPDGKFATILEARKFLQDNGWKPVNQAVATKEAEEFIENAVVLAARDIIKGGKARGPATVYDRLVGLYDRQPRLGSRTSTSMAEQAYSTPAPLAYIASRLADIEGGESVYEPTAGNGMLLIEADPAKQAVRANELNPTRAANLRGQGFNVTQEDAMERTRHGVDRIIANPPFGAVRSGGESTVFEIGNYRTTAIDQAISLKTLEGMKADGRAVLIVGSVKEGSEAQRSDNYNTSQKRKFYKRLYDNYNVVEHFTVSGDLYQKQGAGWPVDVIVIDGKGKSAHPLPAVRVPKVVSSWAALKDYLDAGSRTDQGEARLPEPTGQQVQPAPGAVARPSSGSAGGSGQAVASRPAVQPARPEGQPAASQPRPDRGQSEADGNLDGRPGREPVAGRADAGGVRVSVAAQPRESRLKADANATGQVPYRPYSRRGTPLNTLVPHALGASMDESLGRIEAQHGDIDAYVADALGYSLDELPNVFSAEQVDAIALAINNVANGDAFIIGDQTGIGKGRVVAAAIRFAHKSGMTPVFVTEKPDLYGDMYRDLGDIKWAKSLGREPKIFMTNSGTTVPLDDEAVEWIIERDEAKAAGQKAPPRRGHFSTSQSVAAVDKQMRDILSGAFKPDVVFTTYDQMNSIKGEETSRRRFMDQLASQAFLIMDESHNAGGQGAKANARSAKGATPPRAEKFREWVGKAKSVMYSSATYAKNPQVMDLYSRTDMAKAVEDPKDLPELIAKGKVPLQQVVASMLAKAGQYARRERSFEGVEYALEVAAVDKGNYAEFANSIKTIFEFDRSISDFRKKWIDQYLKETASGMAMDSGIGEIAANSTEFASIMHNIVNQMLLSIKANAAADKALASLANGEKPVISLAFTAESFVTDYAEDKGISFGDEIDIDFRDVVRRYLERTLRITLKDEDDNKSHIYIPVDELGEFEDAYHRALETVNRMDLSAMPVSPIDQIRQRLKDAGYKVAEVTGRQTMLTRTKGGNLVYATRPSEEQGASGKRATIKKFNDGGLDAVILNKSGSTGVSMHASSKFKDKRRRRMILAQADPNIDTHMQMLGRVHRTGQVIPPAYTQLAADIPAEARPTAVLMKKMASLNANTTASRKSAFTTDTVDFMNEYGDLAAVQWAKDNPEINERLGAPIKFDDKGKLVGENPIQKLTGRIMLLDPDAQQDLLDNLTQSYNTILAQKEALGENALEAKALDLQAEPVSSKEIKPATGSSPFQEAATMETMRVKSTGRAMKPRDIIDKVADELGQRPTTDDFEQGLNQLQRIGQRKADNQINAVREEHQKYVQWTVGGLKDPEAKTRATTKANDEFSKWIGIMRLAPVGGHVTLVSGDREMPAIVLDVHQSNKKAKSPTAGSAWSVTLAIPDSARQLTVPFSQIATVKEEDSDQMVLTPPGWQDRNLTNLGQRFEQAAKEGKEERLIATGNLLAAFDQLNGKGQIVQFTDANGDVRPGIMMPRGFDMAEWEADRRIALQTSGQVIRFLTESEGKSATTKDDVVNIDNTYRGYEFSMPASRAKGGKYFTDATVRKVYDNWTKSGMNMVATVDQGTAERLIAAMQKIGARFVAPGEPELASSIAYGKERAMFSRRAEAFNIREQTGSVETEFVLTEAFVEKAEALSNELRKELDGLGLSDVGLRVSEKISAIADGQRFEADGRYFRNLIDIALDAADPAATLNHEALHALRNMGLFSDAEWAILSRKSKAEWLDRYGIADKYGDIPDWAQVEEGIAHAYGDWSAGERTDGIIARSFKRINAFLEALRNALKGLGFNSSDAIFRQIAKGEVGARDRRGRGVSDAPKMSVRPDATETDAFKRWFKDSKVTNEDGSPQVVYHNGHVEFEAFDRMASAKRFELSFNNLGLWFSSKSEREGGAGMYGPKQVAAYLSMQKPFVIHGHETREMAGARGEDAAWSKFWKLWSKLTDEASSPAKSKSGFEVREPTRTARRDPEPMRKWLKENGYDGLILRNTFADVPSSVSTPHDMFIVLEPNQIKAVSNRGTFDPSDDRMMFSLVERRELTDATGIPSTKALSASLGRRMMEHIKRGNPDGESVGEYSHRKMIDYLHPLRTMIESAGGTVQDTMNAYLQARLAEDAALARIQDMHGEYVSPMVEALAKSGASLEDFHRYLYARHVAERNRVVGARNPEDSDFFKAIDDHDIKGASGWSTNEAKRVLRELGQNRESFAGLQEAARLMRGMLNKNLLGQKKAGLISDETYELLTEQWKHYVPLRADDGMDANGNFRPGRGAGFDVRGKEFQGATGRFSEAENIPAWAVSLAERTHLRAEKNAVGKSVLRFLNQYDPEGENLAQVYWTGEEGFGDIEKAPAVYRRVIGKDGKVQNQKVPYSTIAPDMFAVKVGGKSFYIKFADEKVGLALKKMGVVDLDALSRLVRKFTGWQSLINTRANPGFVPINIIRDAMTGGIHLLDEGFNAKEVGRILKSIPKAWGALWRNAKGRPNMESPYDRALKEYIGAGGKITFEPHKTIEDSIDELRDQMKVAAEGQSKPRAMWEAFKFFVGALNDVGENGIRLATYVAQREKGKTVKQAAFSARDLTVDFKKHGEIGPLMNSWFVFFNASIQGGYNIGARLAKSKKIRRAAYTIAASAVLVDLMNRALSGDDEDEESYYSKLLRTKPWLFERSMVLFFGSEEGDYITIPMPYGYNAIYNVGLQAAAAAHGDIKPLEALANTARVAFDAFNPIGSGGSFLNFVVPTILDPVADIYTNMNFTGAPISPTRFPGQDDPDSQRYFGSTPDWARKAADWMNTATGGDEIIPGLVDVTPDTIEHLWGYVVGGTGRFFGQVWETGASIATGDEIEPENVPWLRSFYGKMDEDSQRGEYYDLREEVANAKTALKGYGELGRPDDAAEYADDHKAAVSSVSAFDQAEKALRKVRKAKREIDGNDELSRSEKEARMKPLEETELQIMNSARLAYARNRRADKD